MSVIRTSTQSHVFHTPTVMSQKNHTWTVYSTNNVAASSVCEHKHIINAKHESYLLFIQKYSYYVRWSLWSVTHQVLLQPGAKTHSPPCTPLCSRFASPLTAAGSQWMLWPHAQAVLKPVSSGSWQSCVRVVQMKGKPTMIPVSRHTPFPQYVCGTMSP